MKLLIIFLSLLGSTALACEPAGSNDWFFHKIEINQESLPKGLEFEPGSGSGWFMNTTATPIIFKTPAHKEVQLKLVSKKVYARDLRNKDKLKTDEYFFAGAWREEEHAYADWLLDLSDQERRKDDQRPPASQLKVPPTRELRIRGEREGKPFTLRGKIQFFANKEYATSAELSSACGDEP